MVAFSIIIPVVSINDYVKESVDRILKNKFDDWELLIIPNNKENSQWKDSRIKIISSGRVSPGEKRDLGANISNGKYLAFLDDDAYPEENWLVNAFYELEKNNLEAIGGPSLTPESNTFWQKVSGAMYERKLLGGDPIRYQQINKEVFVEDWPSVNLIVSKKAFDSVGGFDCKFWPGEDTLFCLKLKQKGISIKYVPNVLVWHHRRKNFFQHLKQLANYGLHRGFFARKYPETSFKLKYFFPSTLFLILIGFIFSLVLKLDVIKYLLGVLLIFYFLSVFFASISLLKKYSILKVLVIFFYSVFSHLTYGLFFLRGFVKNGQLQSKLR